MWANIICHFKKYLKKNRSAKPKPTYEIKRNQNLTEGEAEVKQLIWLEVKAETGQI